MLHPQRTDEGSLLALWQEQLRTAARNPFLFQLLLQQYRRVLKRLAYFYQQLASLPRRNRRALQRALATSLVGAAMLLALSSAPIVHAATITVNDSTDTLHGAGCAADGTTAPCSLRDALTFAYNNTGPHTIDLQFAAAGTTLSSPLPSVKTAVTIQGNGKFISGGNSYQVLYVQSTGDLTIDHTTIRDGYEAYGAGIENDGKLTVQNQSVITGNIARVGGGIANYHGKVYVTDTAITGNTADYSGGGIESYGDAGYLVIQNSTLSGNAAGIGGGVDAYINPFAPIGSNIAKIYDSTITGTLEGGGVSTAYSYEGGLVLGNDIIANNYSTGAGAGVNCQYSSVMMSQTSVTGNSAYIDVGGVDLDRCYSGIAQSTISGNFAVMGGPANGGVDVDGSFVRMANSTVSGNTSNYYYGGIGVAGGDGYGGYLYLDNSTVAGNSSESGPGGGLAVYYDSAVYLGRNIISGNRTNYSGSDVFVFTGFFRHSKAPRKVKPEKSPKSHRISGQGWKSHTATVTPDTPVKHKVKKLATGRARKTRSPERLTALGTVSANDFNLFGENSKTTAQSVFGFIPGITDLTATSDGTNPTSIPGILALLGDNGGIQSGDPNTGTTAVQTHALVSSGPAVDRAPNAECTGQPVNGVDERDLPRNVNINNGNPSYLCDIGAFEVQRPTAINVAGVRGSINKNDNVVLRWRTTTETQIAGFDIYRQGKQGEWKQINKTLRQAKHSGASLGDKYRFTDRKAKGGKTYRYKIRVHYLDGHNEWTGVVRVTKP